MSELAENNQWYRERAPQIEKFQQDKTAIISQVAGQVGMVPGFLVRQLTLLELQLKYSLSDINYKITQEAIERELAQVSFDYDLDYKEQLLAWELEKATLLDDLQRELALAKKERSDDEHTLAMLAITVGFRQAALINAKTLLDLEKEALQKELVETQGLTLTKETELAQQKLATAIRKLDLIPAIEALILAQEDLLSAETLLVPLTEELINARLDQIPIKEEIADLKIYLIEAMNALTNPKLAVAEKKSILANAKIAYETRAADKITPATNLATSLTALNAALSVYINKREELVDPYLERATKLSELIDPKTEYAAAITSTVPYIQELAIKRQELIAPSLAKAEALTSLIDPTIQKAEAELDYAEMLKRVAEIEIVTKEIFLLIEGLKLTQVNADLTYLAAQLEQGDLEKALIAANIILNTLKTEHATQLTEDDAIDTAEYLTLKEAGQEQVIADNIAASEYGIDSNYQVAQIKMKTALDSIRTTIEAQAGNSGSIEKISRLRADASVKKAKIQAGAEITSKLIHTLS